MFVIIVILGVIGLIVALGFAIQGPPYVATDDKTANQMIELVKDYRPRRILDMGSGDGKLVMLLALQGYKVDGIEINPWLVLRSRRAIRKAGLTDKAHIIWGSFWTYNVASYDVVLLYVIKHIMPRLEYKLSAELPKNAHIISNYFILPNAQPVKQLGRVSAYTL